MEDPILPRKPWKDREALQKRLEQAAESMRREEVRLRRVSGWATLGLALAIGVISGCAPTAVYGGPPPNLQTPAFQTPTLTPPASSTPSADEQPSAKVYGMPRARATPIINQQPASEVYGAPRPPKDSHH